MYSKEFINKVKKVYPNSKDMHKMAESGNHFLGRYLDDSSQGGISPDDILLSTSLDKIQEKARNLKMRQELYSNWYNETRK